ncbi:DUF5597 domain-containing protein [Flavobacterium aquidurense]|uniref:GH35 family beta-galactosidase n=1 Tax=Flavobacterium aquidurense TaxID=362413 RepID=UPI0028666D1B|nr:DUF5597 domain-containing protein [Flavobacterium aquidurense]MDR7370242.1 hypothetical protein [Flavobacterium aquidurense]
MNMKFNKCIILPCLMLILGMQAIGQTKKSKEISHLQKRGEATQLIVDGKPFLILGGELHNSSTSSLSYMQPILPYLSSIHLNTTLAAISWDLSEPKEGQYDFTLVDGLLKQARQNNMRLILLWFGSWKNGLSHYVPDWVKSDYKRFPRVKLADGNATETISPFCTEAKNLDAKAFAALMKHLYQNDAERTVIMVQVENEVGVIGASRDHSIAANNEFLKQVPESFLAYIKKNESQLQPELKSKWNENGSLNSGTWSQVFGNGYRTDEIFMAYQYATYIDAVAAAGKAEYDLPMFVNAWIVQPEDHMPGNYPSGGPQSINHDIYRMAAPHINILSPDIYLPDFKDIAQLYAHDWNPLFIPESFSDSIGVASAFYTVGFHKGIGYSPFGIDGIRGKQISGGDKLSKGYKVLSEMMPKITEAQSAGTITAVYLKEDKPEQTIVLGDYKIDVALRKTRGEKSKLKMGYAIIINTSKNEYILAGEGLQFTFSPITPGPKTAGFASVYEGSFSNGQWVEGRKLNGDNIMLNYILADEAAQNKTGSVARFESDDPEVLKVQLYRFE